MDFLELSRSRFSVVDYSEQPVEQEALDQILDAALAAPTACNNQPQRILVIADDESREKLSRAVPLRYHVPAAFLVCYDETACWVRPFDRKSSGDIDASIVATHMMLEATDLGLGSIWVMYWDPQKVKEEFALPEHIVPVALLIVGHRGGNAAPRKGHFVSREKDEIML